MNILPIDQFVVINQTILTELDRKNLVMLYQPIIGFTAVSLYFTLWTYIEKNEITSEEYNHASILDNMKISILEFINARERLEALGLLKSYLNENDINSYVYEIYSPLSASKFLNNPILNTLLYSSLDKKRYKKIVDYYRFPSINLEEYKNVTKNLFDVFEIGAVNKNSYEDIKKITRGVITVTPKVELNVVLSLIPDELLNKRLINTLIKDELINYSLVYDFDNNELKDIIEESIIDKKIDMTLFNEKAKAYYEFENYGKTPNLIDKSQPEYLRKQNTTLSNLDKMIYQYETTIPHEFLKLKYNGGKVSSYDIETLKTLINEIKLNPGVVNVLIDYVLKINDNKLTRNFVLVIASQWKRENIQTVSQAIEISKKENKLKHKKVTKKEAIKPDWVGKDVEVDTDPTKMAEMEEILKKYR